MPTPAQVRSVASIENFRSALARFQERVEAALDTLDGELRRAADWLQYDRPSYWKDQLQSSEKDVQQAKLDLERCLIFPVAGERPACREERAVLKKVQIRIDYCREKQQRVKHWQRELHHELFEYNGRVGQFRRILETELPMARGKLEKIIRRLDEYQIEQPPTLTETLKQEFTETTTSSRFHKSKAETLPEVDSPQGSDINLSEPSSEA